MKDKYRSVEYFTEQIESSTEMVNAMFEGMQETSDDNVSGFLSVYLLNFKSRFLCQCTLNQSFDDYSNESQQLLKAISREKSNDYFTGDVIDCLCILVLTNQPEELIAEYLGHMKRFGCDNEIFYMMAGLEGFSLVKKNYPVEYYKNLYLSVKERSTNLLFQFLDAWYSASSHEAWHNSHKDESNTSYSGYWCIEAAAIAKTHNLWDDRILNHEHFPKDFIV